MDWDRLYAFLAVAEHGGFSAAGRAVGRTQSAVSQAVAGLERQLGQQLFHREARGATLTEAGRILLAHAQQAETELQDAKRRLAALSPSESDQLRIGTTDTLGCYLLPEALSAFRTLHPRTEVHMIAGTSPAIAEAVAEGKVEAGVVSLPLPDSLRPLGRPLASSLQQRRLSTLVDVAVVRADHALGRRARISLAELAQHELLLLAKGTAGRDQLDGAFAAEDLRPQVRMESNSVELLKRMVELGFGVAILPAMAVHQGRRPGSASVTRPTSTRPASGAGGDVGTALVAIELTGTELARWTGLILPRQPLSSAALAFCQVVQQKLSRRLP